MNDIKRDNMICKNPMAFTLKGGKRYIYGTQPREESIFKYRKVKRAGLPEDVTPTNVFDFSGKQSKPKETKPIKKDKRFDTKTDSKQNKVKFKDMS